MEGKWQTGDWLKVHLYPIASKYFSAYLGEMPNIKFNYLYRDSGNYKKYGFLIFANPNNLDILEVERIIRDKLIWGEWFYAEKWELPELFTEGIDFRIDPTWHEFESIENTFETPDKHPPIEEFIKCISHPHPPAT